jgi:hypothetical protein
MCAGVPQKSKVTISRELILIEYPFHLKDASSVLKNLTSSATWVWLFAGRDHRTLPSDFLSLRGKSGASGYTHFTLTSAGLLTGHTEF